MTISFYLAYPNAEKSSIVCLVRHGKKRLRLGTGIVIPSISWNSNTQRIKKGYTQEHLNRQLKSIDAKVDELFHKALANNVEEPLQYVRDFIFNENVLYDRKTPRQLETQQSRNILFWYQEYLQEIKDKPNSRTKRVMKTTTHRQQKVTFHHFCRFLQSISMKRLTFDDIFKDNNAENTRSFNEKYMNFLFNKIGLTSNTVAANIKRFRRFLFWCVEKGLMKKGHFTDYINAGGLNKETTMFALTDDELKLIEQVNLEDEPKLDRVRDLFLIQTYTGLRFSDVQHLNTESIQEDRIYIRTIKTGEQLYLPITSRLRKVLNKYKLSDKPVLHKLPTISNQKANDYLKVIAEHAGLTRKHTIIRYDMKGQEIRQTLPIHKLLSTHAARRTLITLSLKKGVNRDIVKEVSGHRHDSSFERYVRFAAKDVSDAMKEAWDEEM